MSRLQTTNDTMPKLGHVTDLREQWLVRTDGALAHRLQDREISSHLCENRYRNQQIREDFPVALSEQMDIERELRQKEAARRRQADVDAEIAREIAEINLRRQRRQHSVDLLQQPGCSRAVPQTRPLAEPIPPSQSCLLDDIDPDTLGLTPDELEEMRLRLEQEERDARLARELSNESDDRDTFLADMRCAVEAQDGELARLLQEREYKKLQRAKEKAKQKALLRKQQRLAAQQQVPLPIPPNSESQATLLDAYSNPRDLIKHNGMRLSKSVDSDLNYVEPFEKEHIQSKANALQSKEISKQWYMQQVSGSHSNQNATASCRDISDTNSHSFDSSDEVRNLPSSQSIVAMQHRQPPPVPTSIKKPRFPDPVSIRPASHYPADNAVSHESPSNFCNYNENNNLYSSTFPLDHGSTSTQDHMFDGTKRLSVISDITSEKLTKKQKKQSELAKKKKGCKIQ